MSKVSRGVPGSEKNPRETIGQQSLWPQLRPEIKPRVLGAAKVRVASHDQVRASEALSDFVAKLSTEKSDGN